ncbi:MAG: hypothetical protein ACREGG_04115, partial [Candidatus Saccharimonadales bacterium]
SDCGRLLENLGGLLSGRPNARIKRVKMKFNPRLLAALLLSLPAILLLNSPAKAATPTPSGITVSPAFQMVQVPTGAAEQPITFTITNNQPTAQTLNLSVADFNTLNESGGLFFVGTNPTALQKQYGLARWVSLPASSITIAPKQTYKLQAAILNLPTLAAGGHYGALMISLNNGSQQPDANNPVGLHPIASSLLFVTKLDGATYDLSLANVYSKHSLFSLPASVTLRFQDTGNTHLIPRGEVTLTGSGNKLISKGIINENSSPILPQTYRRYTVQLRKVASTNSIDKYALRVDFRFDGLSQFRSYQASFWVLPAYILAVVIALVLLAGAFLVWLRRHAIKHVKK